MEGLTWEQREEIKANLLRCLGFKTSDQTLAEQARLLDEYAFGLRAASRSLHLNTQELQKFDTTVKLAIGACRHGWPRIKKPEVRATLTRGNAVSAAFADRAIDLGLRVWLMLDCCLDESTAYPNRWSDDEHIADLLDGRFEKVEVTDNAEPITRFPRKFRAVNMHTLANITIQWTSFLDEHLRFDEDNREIKVFNNKAWLVAMLQQSQASELDGPSEKLNDHQDEMTKEVGLPRALLIETIKTLDVLFPPWHEPTEKFLQAQNQEFHLLPPIPRDVPKLREFAYWKYRLLDLIVEYESPPPDWTRIWRDRRNPTAFWTFWIGIAIFILTLVFGIAASVLAGIQIELAGKDGGGGGQ